MTTFVIADDHDVVRYGTKALLETHAGWKVVAEAADGQAAVQAVEKHRPAVLLLDLNLPRLHGLEVLRTVRAAQPQTKVIILSMHNDEAYVIEALRAGAMGYLLKGSPSAEITAGVQAVLAGRRHLSAPLSEWAITALAFKQPDQSDPYHTLSPREREVLQLAAEGLSNAEVAEKLFISPRTADTHRANLLRKLALQTQTDLVRYAIRRGLLEP